jgi:hypothetical protein
MLSHRPYLFYALRLAPTRLAAPMRRPFFFAAN